MMQGAEHVLAGESTCTLVLAEHEDSYGSEGWGSSPSERAVSHRSWPVLCRGPYFRMFTARATTRIPTTSEIVSSAIIMSFAHGFIAETSVGLNAIEVL